MTQKEAFAKSMRENPSWGTYIHLCGVFAESGAKRKEILKAFNYYMPENEYDLGEKKELIDYLEKISLSVPE